MKLFAYVSLAFLVLCLGACSDGCGTSNKSNAIHTITAIKYEYQGQEYYKVIGAPNWCYIVEYIDGPPIMCPDGNPGGYECGVEMYEEMIPIQCPDGRGGDLE